MEEKRVSSRSIKAEWSCPDLALFSPAEDAWLNSRPTARRPASPAQLPTPQSRPHGASSALSTLPTLPTLAFSSK